jgi:DNA-directed RNA polymerase subunit beta'
MLKTTIGQIMVNDALPDDLKDYSKTLDSKSTQQLMQSIAERYPDRYREISKKLLDVGRDVSYNSGGFSFGLKDMRESKFYSGAKDKLKVQIDRLMADRQDDDKEKNRKITELLNNSQKDIEKGIFDESSLEGNQLARQVQSGSRGKAINLKSLRGGDMLYTDHHDNAIPIPVFNSYSKGLNSAEYFAGSFGARKGVTDTKFSTMDAGFFSKQLNQIGHRMIVTSDDSEDPRTLENRGMPVSTDDDDNEGALLAMPAGGYGRNTVLTSRVLKDLKAKGLDHIVVRSPVASGSPDGGIYSKDLGIRERSGLSPIGDSVGIAAMQALSEPISQGQLNSKHTGGVSGATASVSGFKHLNQLVQVPKQSPYWASHAEKDGRVAGMRPAPSGGVFINIDGTDHYLTPEVTPNVKIGDVVEAGDAISSGIPNPAKFTKFKGIGEGRRQFVMSFKNAMREAGMSGHRRNIEVMSKGLINHVILNDEYKQFAPDDVVPYDSLEHSWEPREGARTVKPSQSVGSYLEKPILHYSIGTPIRPSMVKNFDRFGIKDVTIHKDPPPCEPHFVRGLENLQHDPDWMTRMLGSNLRKSTLHAVHRGAVSEEAGTSYVPSLAKAVDFGRKGVVKGFDVKDLGKMPDSNKGVMPDLNKGVL